MMNMIRKIESLICCTMFLLKVLIPTNQSQVALSGSRLVLKFSLQRNETCSFKDCGSSLPLISPLQGENIAVQKGWCV